MMMAMYTDVWVFLPECLVEFSGNHKNITDEYKIVADVTVDGVLAIAILYVFIHWIIQNLGFPGSSVSKRNVLEIFLATQVQELHRSIWLDEI